MILSVNHAECWIESAVVGNARQIRLFVRFDCDKGIKSGGEN